MTFRVISKGLIALVVVLALTLGSFVTPALAAPVTAEEDCELDEGGTWMGFGGSVSDGMCFVEIPGYCPGFNYTALVYLSDFTAYVGCKDTIDEDENGHFATVGSAGGFCIEEGGIWTGDLAGENGTCTFPAGHEIAVDDCGPGLAAVFEVVNDVVFFPPTCMANAEVGGSGSGDTYPPYGRFGTFTGGQDDGGSLSLGGSKNGSVSFDAGTCAGKCTVSPNLPGGAKASLPDDVLATLYFRSTDADGEPGTGTYTVCFAVGDLTNSVIYRFVGGAWVAQSVTISGGQVCTTGSGDGAFALGGS